jgi:2-C-methyl-D-erythritol 4-phosphate cytidylyltransferase
MNTLAIIPAGGTGRRMESGVPKQYLPLAGLPVLVHTLQAFQVSPVIDEIFVVVPEGDIPEVRQAIVEKHCLSKVSLVLAGGRQRQDSVRNALRHARDEHAIILIHDGVRPFISGELIRRSVAGAEEYGAVTSGVRIKDTVKDVNVTGWITKTVDREGLWLTHTPQAFRRPLIQAAYKKAAQDGVSGTDDASLVERLGIPVRMISGDYDNIKLTTPEDLALGEIIIRRLQSEKAG